MAFAQALSPQSMHQPYRDQPAVTPPMRQRQASKQRFVAELSQCLFDFVIQLLPTQEEMAVKEDVRRLLERLIRTIEPDSRLLSFGSTANGFSLRNSDMDLCCLIDSEERLGASDLVTMLGDLLERETKFHVKPLPHARIPIVKLSLDPSPGLPLGIACDIGFENRLALENTRLLMCYAMIDPTRVRTMVLFLKVWSKRRKINSPYKGTLSSYGYVLLVIYFLVHVKNPPVLPNLQQMPPLRPISKDDTHLNGHNIWFFDDIELLRQRWHSENNETVAELLIDFFRYYSRDFLYNTGVASIRAGLLKKESKGWQNELTGSRYNDARERNRLCVEDPFETDYNVARCVTKDGLYTIRGEFMRASRVLAARPERAIVALAELCEERKDEELVAAPPYQARPQNLPPQTPYTVGNQTLRPKVEERFSPPAQFFERGQPQTIPPVTIRPPPEHMAPKRGKWTSPPPAEAPSADHTLFENQLGIGLQLATSNTDAREQEQDTASTSSASESGEVFTDEGSEIGDDDITSVRSFTEGSAPISGQARRPSWHTHETLRPEPTLVAISSGATSSRSSSSTRGRFTRPSIDPSPPTAFRTTPESASALTRRSISGPPARTPLKASPSLGLSSTPLAIATPLPPSPDAQANDPNTNAVASLNTNEDNTNVYYQTSKRSPRPSSIYPSPHGRSPQHSPLVPHNQTATGFVGGYIANPIPVPRDIFPPNMPPALSSLNPRSAGLDPSGSSFGGPDTPTPSTYQQHSQQQQQQLHLQQQLQLQHSHPLHPHSLHSRSLSSSTATQAQTPSQRHFVLPSPGPTPGNQTPSSASTPPLPHHSHSHSHSPNLPPRLSPQSQGPSRSPQQGSSFANRSPRHQQQFQAQQQQQYHHHYTQSDAQSPLVGTPPSPSSSGQLNDRSRNASTDFGTVTPAKFFAHTPSPSSGSPSHTYAHTQPVATGRSPRMESPRFSPPRMSGYANHSGSPGMTFFGAIPSTIAVNNNNNSSPIHGTFADASYTYTQRTHAGQTNGNGNGLSSSPFGGSPAVRSSASSPSSNGYSASVSRSPSPISPKGISPPATATLIPSGLNGRGSFVQAPFVQAVPNTEAVVERFEALSTQESAETSRVSDSLRSQGTAETLVPAKEQVQDKIVAEVKDDQPVKETKVEEENSVGAKTAGI